jgi:hypothetical protein
MGLGSVPGGERVAAKQVLPTGDRL